MMDLAFTPQMIRRLRTESNPSPAALLSLFPMPLTSAPECAFS
jgi:hypothetical protein